MTEALGKAPPMGSSPRMDPKAGDGDFSDKILRLMNNSKNEWAAKHAAQENRVLACEENVKAVEAQIREMQAVQRQQGQDLERLKEEHKTAQKNTDQRFEDIEKKCSNETDKQAILMREMLGLVEARKSSEKEMACLKKELAKAKHELQRQKIDAEKSKKMNDENWTQQDKLNKKTAKKQSETAKNLEAFQEQENDQWNRQISWNKSVRGDVNGLCDFTELQEELNDAMKEELHWLGDNKASRRTAPAPLQPK